MEDSDSTSEMFGILKLKGTENWTTWIVDIKRILVLNDLWDYASGLEVEAVAPTAPQSTPGSSSSLSNVDAAEQEKYQKEKVAYEADMKKWLKGHEKSMAIIRLTCEPDPKIAVINKTNARTALETLKNWYGSMQSSWILQYLSNTESR